MKQWLRNNRGMLVFLLVFGCFRTAVADWNPVPSGSMRPTILEGDVVWVNRLAYDIKLPLTDVVLARLADPRRGDVVTFGSPKDGTRLIKRLVALPGDVVALHEGRLSINGRVADYADATAVREPVGRFVVDAVRAVETTADGRRAVQLLTHFGSRRSFGPVVVPQDHYFVLGDNRDNSEDSRVIGFVARERLIGRAERVVVSADISGNWLPRWSRWLSRLQ